MDINPLIADLNKYKEEILDVIEIAIQFNELNKSDAYVASHIAEIIVGKATDRPFQLVANLYSLPIQEVVNNIRYFTNRAYKTDIMSDFVSNYIDFESVI